LYFNLLFSKRFKSHLLQTSKYSRGETMKEWRCILVNHHDEVGKAIMEWEQQGWQLHSYTTAGMGGAFNYTVNHSLLFERGE